MEEEEQQQESRRLKSVAEAKCKDSNFKSALKNAKRAQRLNPNLEGISSMVTTFKILHMASKSPNPNWYKILQVEPFAHTNTVKKKYKELAFLLHPDKNRHAGSEEAFKLVNEAFRFLSDKLRRKEYDMRLRIKIQDEKIKESSVGDLDSNVVLETDTFWTACSTCQILHQFERRYLGHNLVCPSCRKSFEAVEVESGENGGGGRGENVMVRTSERLRNSSLESKGKIGRERQGRTVSDSGDTDGGGTGSRWKHGVSQKNGEMGGRRLRRRMSSVGEVMERSQPKKAKTSDEIMTLAEMRSEIKKKAGEEKMKMELKLKHKKDEREKKEKREKLRHTDLKKSKNLEAMSKSSTSVKIKDLRNNKSRGLAEERNSRGFKSENVEIMTVEDSDFYDFDKDRAERSFKKGQVWAIYDDDDGMPRHYGLIDEVVSVYPFEVKMSWLDLQNSGNECVASWEEMEFHVCCGRFKVSRKTSINSVNIFSHVVDCERVAREVYHIYPKKGSVWALYKEEAALDGEGRNQPAKDERSYDIVVFLTTFSEMHGLSLGYLEKVDGFKTVFKRKEIGSHAIRCLEKSDVRLVSHQIPARKLNGDEAPNLLKDCWELDPASLPQDLLTFCRGR